MKKIKIVKHKEIRWYKVLKPGEEELKYLQEKFNFHPLDIEDCLEKVQRPKLDIYRNYVFLILHFPRWHRKTLTLETIELKVFLGPNFLITLSDVRIPVLNRLFYQAKNSYNKRARFFKNSSFYLFYFLLNQLLISINPIMKNIGQIINEIDHQILKGHYKATLEQISIMRRNLILFQTIIKPQIPIFKALEEGKARVVDRTYDYYWGNLVDRLQSLWEQLENYSQILEGLATTNESLLSYKTNEIIKILTIFNVVLLPLSLISGIYGMNIKTLPFLYSPFSFTIISAVMIAVVIIMLLFFKIKGWI